MFYESEVKGFDEFQDLLKECEIKEEKVVQALVKGAKAFVDDARRLPSPRSRIKKAGYTHLLDTIAYEVKGEEVEVGWGKYYGPMVENGTKKMKAQPHLVPLFKRNKEKYYKEMSKDLFKEGD